MKKVVIIFFLALAGLLYSRVSADNPGEAERLQNLKDELSAKRSEYDKIGVKEQDELSRLRRLEEQIALSGQLILKIERAVNRLERDIRDNRSELNKSNATLEKKKQVLDNRLKYVYMVGNRPGWSDILLSKNPTEAITALENMRAILAYDRHLVESYNRLSKNIESGIVKLDRDRDQLVGLKEDYQDEMMQRKVALETRKKLLGDLRKDKNVISRAMDRLEEDSRSISGIFDDIQADSGKADTAEPLPGLEKKKGDLIWPTYGDIIRPFGTRTDKRGIKLTNPGIDIKAGYGSKVSVAAAGRVIYVSWLRGYGQFIIVDHGANYYTLYANLGSVMVDTGDMVKAGQTIALVGDSGSLEGSRLHFELRHKKQQLDPVSWLR